MIKTNLVLLFILGILSFYFLACQSEAQLPEAYTYYFPKGIDPYEGYAIKQYVHFPIKEGKEIATNIRYSSIKLSKNQELTLTDYDAGLDPEYQMTLVANDTELELKSVLSNLSRDTINLKVGPADFLNFKTSNNQYDFYNDVHHTKVRQTGIKDTTILNQPAKIITKKSIYTRFSETDTIVDTAYYKQIFIKNFGPFFRNYTSNSYQSSHELVEQITMKKFKKMLDNYQHRIAYIDPKNTLEYNPDFTICNPEYDIYDYYNSDPDAGYTGGKFALKNKLFPQIDTTLLFDESGYLTFRFIINCNGEIGRFTTEMADLDFNKKSFNPKTVKHLGDLIAPLDTWNPCIVRGEKRDAYAYITFKLKDGKIIELLP